MQRLRFDELHIGDSWESHARTITETDVVNFACLTGDFDPLHVDHESAAKTPFGRPVAHGLLGLSFLAGLGTNAPNVHTVAFLGIQNWRFQKPIFVGDTVRAVTRVVAVTPNGRRSGRVTWYRELLNQSGEIVQSGSFETAVATAATQIHSELPGTTGDGKKNPAQFKEEHEYSLPFVRFINSCGQFSDDRT